MKELVVAKLVTRLAMILLVLSLLLPVASAPIAAAEPRRDPVHPMLARMVGQNPDGTARIIVQGNDPNVELAAEVDRQGGKGKKVLPIVKGFAVELPAAKVRALARHPNVKWVTIDTPMAPTVGSVAPSHIAAPPADAAPTNVPAAPAWPTYGTTQDGFSKPEVVAPGRRIVSNLASPGCVLAMWLRDRVVDKTNIRLSGTSTAASVVSGVVALTLQAHPDWTPDQVKWALTSTERRPPLARVGAGAGEVDPAAVVATVAPAYANQGIPLNYGVVGAAGTALCNSAAWNSATWNSATWNSATWNAATWNPVTRDSLVDD